MARRWLRERTRPCPVRTPGRWTGGPGLAQQRGGSTTCWRWHGRGSIDCRRSRRTRRWSRTEHCSSTSALPLSASAKSNPRCGRRQRNVLEWRFDPRCEARLAVAPGYERAGYRAVLGGLRLEPGGGCIAGSRVVACDGRDWRISRLARGGTASARQSYRRQFLLTMSRLLTTTRCVTVPMSRALLAGIALLTAAVVVASCRGRQSTATEERTTRSSAETLLGRPYDGPAAETPRGADGKPLLTGYWKLLHEDGKPDGNLGKDGPTSRCLTPRKARRCWRSIIRTVDPEARCIITGIPRLLTSVLPFEILHTPERLGTFHALSWHRWVWLDGRAGDPEQDPGTWQCDRTLGWRDAGDRIVRLSRQR